MHTRTSFQGKIGAKPMWSFVSHIAFGLLFVALGGVGVLLGVSALKDIRTGRTQSLSRMSSRVFKRAESPTDFWVTIATGVLWGVFGAFLLTFGIVFLSEV